ncbi:MAG: PH domain-containing protein [Planctomycetota bacterium]|jgi:membrane protein YdbS with pleckstrin-like domain
METVTTSPPQTKPCPYCAEIIQLRAVKCRFCSEFLNTAKAKALETPSAPDPDSEEDDHIRFSGRPSLWAMVPAAIKGAIFLALAVFLMRYPVESASVFQPAETTGPPPSYDLAEELTESDLIESPADKSSVFTLTDEQALVFGKYRIIAGIGLAIVIVLALLLKMVKLKMTYYEVSADRIEWSRGLLDRKVDNLDMFRVVDLSLRRSLLDCLFGIGTVGLITTDKTDPEFTFDKMRRSRRLYDVIKKASLDADRRNAVVHLE